LKGTQPGEDLGSNTLLKSAANLREKMDAPTPSEPLVAVTLAEADESDIKALAAVATDKELPTLEKFGLQFNQDGQLRNIEGGTPFVYDVFSGDKAKNQERYEAVGKCVDRYVYQLLVEKAGLEKVTIPIDPKGGEPTTCIFKSPKTTDKLLLLIHGSGVVRAGQWARKLIINESIDKGTQIPYIKKAIDSGYTVIVLNTNDNSIIIPGKKKAYLIRGCESPEKHALYVWDNFVSNVPYKDVSIVAHSYGGVVTFTLLAMREEELLKRVSAVAFTDSVHFGYASAGSSQASEWITKIARNWVSSDKPLDTPLSEGKTVDVPRVSAGTTVHEETSTTSMASVFAFLNSQLEKRAKAAL